MTGYESKRAAAQDKLAQPALEPNWTCNECGAQEFTAALSEADLDYLACANCGGDEFHKEALAQPAQELAIPSTQDAASKVGPFWQEFSVVYEAIGKQQITIREIAWRCFLAAKMTTQPAQEPVAWMHPVNETCVTTDPTAYARGIPLYATPPQRPWVGLAQDEQMQIWDGIIKYAPSEMRIKDFAQAIEAKLKEKNT